MVMDPVDCIQFPMLLEALTKQRQSLHDLIVEATNIQKSVYLCDCIQGAPSEPSNLRSQRAAGLVELRLIHRRTINTGRRHA